MSVINRKWTVLFMVGSVLLIACVVFLILDFRNSGQQKQGPSIIIDNDAGADDAAAIFLALLYEKHFNGPTLVGLTTGNGNTNEDNVATNNQRILQVAKRQDVPIYRGSKQSILETLSVPSYFGEDGLGDTGEELKDLAPAAKEGAVSALIRFSKEHEGNLTVMTIGTLTNVALAIRLDPGFLGRLAHLYIGAGHIHDEHNPEPEFNAHMDVEAYHIVMQNASPNKVTVFPFSQTISSLNISTAWRVEILGKIDSDIMRALNSYERIVWPKSDSWHMLDPAVIALVLRPDLVDKYVYSSNSIVTCGDDRGKNTNTFVDKDQANVRMVHSMKMEPYKQFLYDVFSADVK